MALGVRAGHNPPRADQDLPERGKRFSAPLEPAVHKPNRKAVPAKN